MKIIRLVPNISSELFAASRDFYVELFDLVVGVELDDWYLQLMSPEDPSLNIGFVKPAHELFAGRAAPAGKHALVQDKMRRLVAHGVGRHCFAPVASAPTCRVGSARMMRDRAEWFQSQFRPF